MTIHIDSIKQIIKTNNIPLSHIATLDETGVTPNRDTNGKLQGKVVMRGSMHAMSGKNQLRLAHLKNVERVTMMPVVFADFGFGANFVLYSRADVSLQNS